MQTKQTGGPGGGVNGVVGSLLFLTVIFFFNFASRMVLAPLLPAMEAELGFGHAEAGSLYLIISVGYCLSMLGAGWVAAALDHRRTILLCTFCVGLAIMALALSSTLTAVRLSAFALGLACGLYLPSGLATLTALVEDRYLGRALALHEVAPNLTFVVVPLASSALMLWYSWRVVLVAVAAASLISALAFGLFGRGGRFKGQPLNLALMKKEALSWPLWRLTGVFTLILGSSMGVYALLPLFLIDEHGMNPETANLLLSLSRISGIFMVFVGGWMADKLGYVKAMALVTAFVGLTTLILGLAQGWWLVLLVFLQPALTGCFFPASFAALAFLGPLNTNNLRVAITVAFAISVGFGVLPAALGFLGEMGSFGAGISALGVVVLLSLALLPGLPNRAPEA